MIDERIANWRKRAGQLAVVFSLQYSGEGIEQTALYMSKGIRAKLGVVSTSGRLPRITYERDETFTFISGAARVDLAELNTELQNLSKANPNNLQRIHVDSSAWTRDDEEGPPVSFGDLLGVGSTSRETYISEFPMLEHLRIIHGPRYLNALLNSAGWSLIVVGDCGALFGAQTSGYFPNTGPLEYSADALLAGAGISCRSVAPADFHAIGVFRPFAFHTIKDLPEPIDGDIANGQGVVPAHLNVTEVDWILLREVILQTRPTSLALIDVDWKVVPGQEDTGRNLEPLVRRASEAGRGIAPLEIVAWDGDQLTTFHAMNTDVLPVPPEALPQFGHRDEPRPVAEPETEATN